MGAPQRIFRGLAGLGLALIIAGCGLPRSGPDKDEVQAIPAEEAGLDFQVIPVTADVARITRIDERSGFEISLVNTSKEPTQLIAKGDVMSITVWENIDEGLLNPQGIGASQLPNSIVDDAGFVFVPYVGLVKAAGRSLNGLREAIQDSLAQKTLNPQVDIFPVEKGGRLISVQGNVNTPGLYPIEKPTRTLLPMIARAGGVSEDPEVTRIKVRRGRIVGEISLQDLYDDPGNDIPIRSGDAVIAERDRRIFTALGAVAGPQTVPFPTRDVSVVRALGIVGGLLDNRADPTGVFIFREEPPEIANRLMPGADLTGPAKVAYIFDLTQPGAVFLARDFMMRSDDTLYVTTAPFVRWLKILQAISPLISFAGTARSLSGQ
ncbi:MAG: polysaccharide biosynthesis/export family protein [Pseudomonadota bacterium]